MNLSRSQSTKISLLILVILLLGFASLAYLKRNSLLPLFLHIKGEQPLALPTPALRSNISIEEALKQRRSIRQYKNEALSLQQVGQVLWAAQGLTTAAGFRTAPSAGGLYPLEIYLVSGKVQNLPDGVYHYLPEKHALELVLSGDQRSEVAKAAHEQHDIQSGAVDLIITGNYKKTSSKYGNRGERFVHMEAGHAAENVYLQTVSLGLGTVSIGVFDELALKKALGIPREEEPLYIMPVGKA